jgi:predicted dehydrogenase
MTPMPFAVVGAGWRAEFYMRIAAALPERFSLVGVVARSAARRDELAQCGVPVYATLDDLLSATTPAFVVTCVPWDANVPLIEELVSRGLPVLSETPPAPDVERLCQVYALDRAGARIQVAEQFIYQPHHAARLAWVASGKLGTPSHVQVSACHGYHGLSLLRHFLGVSFEPVTVRALRFRAPLIAGPGRDGPPRELKMVQSEQVIAWIEFPDRLGIYDFAGDQYFSWVRHQRLLVRGERGEIIDQTASSLRSYDDPLEVRFLRLNTGENGNLEGLCLKGIIAGDEWVYRNPFVPACLSDEEIAMATSLLKMGEYVAGGAPPYPLAQACQDRYLDILIAQAVASGERVASQPQPWHQ